MQIEIELVSPAGLASAERPLRARFEYNQVRIVHEDSGEGVVEAVEAFLSRPYLQRYKALREGRVQFLKNGVPLDLTTVLSYARTA